MESISYYQITMALLSSTILFVIFSFLLAFKYRSQKKTCKRLKETISDLKEDSRQERYTNQRRIEEAKENFAKNLKASMEIENVHLLSQAIASQDAKTMTAKMKEILEKQFDKMSQEFIGSISDETDGLINDVQIALSEKVWDSIQQMKEKQDDSPYIIPRNSRVAYTKGDRTIVVIEQEPQVRTLKFTEELLSNREKNDAVSVNPGGIYCFQLAMPYVYFFLVFEKARFKYLEVFVRNKPLQSTREHVYCAPLPNINHNDSNSKFYNPMCLGNEFWATFKTDSTMSRQCEDVVSHFWQAPFNAHLGKFGVVKNKDVDKRVKDYSTWQSESAKDSLFVLSVSWENGSTVKGIMENLFERREKHALNGLENQIKKMLNDGVSKITTRLKTEIKTAQKNSDIKPEVWVAKINTELESVVTGHASKVFDICKKQAS